ncbi:glycosyltransferase family 2 protein [Leisingera sp. HS039]|uniref:glycosyltransferase family 2 protein n=1 Tax=unclassified Leisingera TaxID=2614906 RepID=UPI001070F849|nr:glycosyltransferase family 2 protein [Leisingera sp. NJS201]MBQ4825312.1 glycosyltransferase family 2 protein [Leisingera sp. HS039]QBR35464.1 glycosyltransferase family 2 protein [Leisingera sp. NJS201]
MTRGVSVLIPAHDEAEYIAGCLQAVFASDPLPAGMAAEVLVLANGCRDETAALARVQQPPAGWDLRILELPEGGKLGALNAGDAAARGGILIYLDADVAVSPALIPQLAAALPQDEPRYASGCPQVALARSAVTRAYARLWTRLPFVTGGVPGFGVFAMTCAGRQRWGDWPDIIADDIFARLNFAPSERVKVPAVYSWPMVEGFRNLVRVRRRQNAGVAEVASKFPGLLQNEDKIPPSAGAVLKLLLSDPAGFAVYAMVGLATKTPLFASRSRWTRGR